MQEVNHYIPTDLEWSANGLPCEPRVLNMMCEQILKNGRISEIVRHTAGWHHADGTSGVHGLSSQVLVVECDHIPCITYAIHLTGFRVTEIIETISKE
jgi:hypothetical protein